MKDENKYQSEVANAIYDLNVTLSKVSVIIALSAASIAVAIWLS